MMTCTITDSKGVHSGEEHTTNTFKFELYGKTTSQNLPISGIAGWFTADFKSRTDEFCQNAPKVTNPATLSTGPENGYTHWGQQTFYFLSSIPILKGEVTTLEGCIEMFRSKDNSRLYDCRISYCTSRCRLKGEEKGLVLSCGRRIENVYQIP